jgi:threonine dehydratase
MISVEDVRAAADRIRGHVVRTPAVPSPGLSALLGAPVTAKLELLQRTGSFKARGAFAKLLTLSDAERAAGVVAVSGGNHGVAVADAAGALGIAATVVMPDSAPARSVAAARSSGATVELTPTMDGAFTRLGELAAAGVTLVHPFDDPVVIAGQGTAGAEFLADAPGVTDVLVSIGGGGLIAGVAVAALAARPDVRIWGVETEGADAMTRALGAGEPVATPLSSIVTTLSAPAVSALTLEHVRALVQDVLTVSDAEAVAGTVALAEHGKLWTEPAAGCLLPAAHRVLQRVGPGAHLGLLVCGGNATVADVARWAATG